MKKDSLIMVLSLIISIAVANCGRQSPAPKEDFYPPAVVATDPVNQSLNNSINTAISVQFSEIIDPASITVETFSLSSAMTGSVIEGDISYADATVILTPTAPLQTFTVYVMEVTTGVRDLAGNPIPNPVTVAFTTGLEGDVTPPDVAQTNPSASAVNVGVNATISITFTEPILASTITTTPVPMTVTTGTITVPGSVSLFSDNNGSVVIFSPIESLVHSTTYTVMMSDSITDLAGNHPQWNNGIYTWGFTTQAQAADITRPQVLSTIPTNSAENVSVNAQIVAVFDEMMLASSVTSTTFLLTEKQTGASVLGAAMVSNATAVFTPANSLKYATEYLVTLVTTTGAAGLTDVAGNPLLPNAPQGYMWNFKTEPVSLTVIKTGTGSGIVTASTGTLTWTGNMGMVTYSDAGTEVTLTAIADIGSTFTGWSGEGCAGTGACTVTMTQARNITATFTLDNRYVLSVIKVGTGNGIVTTSTGTLTWTGSNGTATYTDYGTVVALTAAADKGSTFTGWSGEGCTGTGICTVTMTQARGVTATFSYNSYPLTVTKSGTGSGIVIANPGTLAWTGTIGTATYSDFGTMVTLTATASDGSTFTGWSGEGCTGTGACTVTMTAARNVTAIFTIYTYTLSVTQNGNGSGTVTVNTGTLVWTGGTGRVTYDHGTQVSLTASPDPGSIYSSWSGCDSSNNNQCSVTMTAEKSVTATFTKQSK
jgi:hypothetical protein